MRRFAPVVCIDYPCFAGQHQFNTGSPATRAEKLTLTGDLKKIRSTARKTKMDGFVICRP
jgi:hypothetical protein